MEETPIITIEDLAQFQTLADTRTELEEQYARLIANIQLVDQRLADLQLRIDPAIDLFTRAQPGQVTTYTVNDGNVEGHDISRLLDSLEQRYIPHDFQPTTRDLRNGVLQVAWPRMRDYI